MKPKESTSAQLKQQLLQQEQRHERQFVEMERRTELMRDRIKELERLVQFGFVEIGHALLVEWTNSTRQIMTQLESLAKQVLPPQE